VIHQGHERHSTPPGLTIDSSCAKVPLADAAVAQLVEHLTENQRVPSSSLGCGTRSRPLRACGRGSAVEHLLAKERVVGSNPIARSVLTRRRSQVERQRSAKPRSRVQIPSSPLVSETDRLIAEAISRLLWSWGGGGTADAADLNFAGSEIPCGFKSHPPHQCGPFRTGRAFSFPNVMPFI
jgi:hypothetical protein